MELKFEDTTAEEANERCVECILASYSYKDPNICVERCQLKAKPGTFVSYDSLKPVDLSQR